MVTGNFRLEESFLISPKAIYLFQLIGDLHPTFANQYLHKMKSDLVISCETKGVAMKTVEKLQQLDGTKSS